MDPIDPLETARRRTGLPLVDLIVGASAILIAVVSLAIAVRQSQIMERQLAASVWPHLQYGTSNQSDDGKQVISFDIENAGVGPAVIYSMRLHYEDRPIRHVSELLEACCAELLAAGKPNWSTSTLHDQVLTPNRQKSFLVFVDTPGNKPYWQRLNSKRHKLRVEICYCSTLNQCWLLDSSSTQQKNLNNCPAPAADDYVD